MQRLPFSFVSVPSSRVVSTSCLIRTIRSCSSTTPTLSLREVLQKDKRYRISVSEYEKLAADTGASKEDVEQLEKDNIIMRIPTVDDFVFIHPERVTSHLRAVIDPDNKHTERKREYNIEKVNEMLTKKAELDEMKEHIESSARSALTRSLWLLGGGFTLQGLLIGRLTWWELSWDTMEPVTYLITFGSSILFLFYFQSTRLDFSYAKFGDQMLASKRKKFYAKKEFDIEAYEKLCRSIVGVQEELVALGEPKASIPSYPFTYAPIQLVMNKE